MPGHNVSNISRSVLRFPGSKARLAKFIADAAILNGHKNSTFVEPFCGGASVGIALLESNLVKEVVFNDIDPLVSSLWKCIFLNKSNAEWLVEAVIKAPLTLEYWKYQKNLKPTNIRQSALKCLYLNRTSFSGVLHKSAGPIGGMAQRKWTIGCRFNKEKIASRILELSNLRSGVRAVSQSSWHETCKSWNKARDVFFYLDPPYYYKAERLYRFVFSDKNHVELQSYLKKLKAPWILSYDNAAEIRELYKELDVSSRIIDSTYSAHPKGGNSYIGREVVYSNLKRLPKPKEKNFVHKGISVRTYKSTGNEYLKIPI